MIQASNLVLSIETFLQNLESRYLIKHSNFVETQTQALFNLSNSDAKFCLIIGENETQKIDFINFLINTSQCSSADEALTLKMSTLLPYSNVSTRKCIILRKDNNQNFVFILISKMDFYNTLPPTTSTQELYGIFRGGRQIHTVILLFSQPSPLKNFDAWIPSQLSKASNNFIYLNLFNKKPMNAEKWKILSETLPTGSLYYLNQKILKQNFVQMNRADCEGGIQMIQQILRKISQMEEIDGMTSFRESTKMGNFMDKIFLENVLKTDVIFYDSTAKRGLSFFDEGLIFSNDTDGKIFGKLNHENL